QRCAERPGLVNRMREWFGHGDSMSYPQSYGGQPSGMYPGTMQSSGFGPSGAYAGSYQPATGPSCACGQGSGLAAGQTTTSASGQYAAQTPPAGPVPVSTTREPDLAKPVAAATFRGGRADSKINPKFVNKIGHEEDYSWVTGQLDRENGHWVVRYATP